jgi:hypothetical protein
VSTRRTFLKLAGAAVGALALTRYAEPLALVSDVRPKYADWIEDRGDFYIVRVPDFQSFARERLKKPTILLLGENATVADIQVDAFVNIQAPKGGRIMACSFDARNVRVGRNRPVVEITDSCDLLLADCVALGCETTGISFVS